MPQMHPLMWFMIFVSSIVSLLAIISIIYFYNNPKPDMLKSKTLSSPQLNWKW